MTLEQMQESYKHKYADFAKDDNFNGFCLDENQLNSLITEVWNEAIKECEGRAEKLSEFDARLAIEPSADFLDGAVAMKKLILKEYGK